MELLETWKLLEARFANQPVSCGACKVSVLQKNFTRHCATAMHAEAITSEIHYNNIEREGTYLLL
jgi:hypothetical protein